MIMAKYNEPVDEIQSVSDPEVAPTADLFLAELCDSLNQSDGHQELTLTATLDLGYVVKHEWTLKRYKLQ
jgi:hypothetical protein